MKRHSIYTVLTTIIITLFYCQVVIAQEADTIYHKNAINVYFTGGASGYWNKMTYGEKGLGLCGGAGLSYSYYFNPEVSVTFGVELAQYNTNLKITNLLSYYKRHETEQEDPINPENLIYHTDVWKMKERNSFTNINIPVGISFYTPIKKHYYFNTISAKLSIPIISRYSLPEFSGRTWGYYYEGTQQELYDQNDLGYFPELVRNFHNKPINVDITGFLSYETGIKWTLNKKTSLTTSIYFDLGLTGLIKNNNKEELVFYDGNSIDINSILTSKYTINDNTYPFADKFNLMSFGIKLTLNTGLTQAKKNERTKQQCRGCGNIIINNVILNGDCQEDADTLINTYNNRDKKIIINNIIKNKNNCNEEGAIMKIIKDNALSDKKLKKILKTLDKYDLIEYLEENEKNKPTSHNDNLTEEQIDQAKITYYDSELKRLNAKYGFNTIHFVLVDGYEFNQTVLTKTMKMNLDKMWDEIQSSINDTQNIIIEGHTCDRGSHQSNVILGEKRAAAVKDYFVSKGFPVSRISVVSKAETEPIVPNTSELNRKQNRRIVIVVK